MAVTRLDLERERVDFWGEGGFAINRLTIFTAVLALAGGALAGYVDFHNDEVQAAVLVLVAVAATCGLLHPRSSWTFGLLASLGIPVYAFVGRQLGGVPKYPGEIGVAGILLPALIGVATSTIAGFVRRRTATA